MPTILIEEPMTGQAVQAVDGSWIVSFAVAPCLCNHTSGNGPCPWCQPAGSGTICLTCRFRGGIPVSDPPPVEPPAIPPPGAP